MNTQLAGSLLLGISLLLTDPLSAQTAPSGADLQPSGVATKTTLAQSLTKSTDHTTLLRLLKASGLTKQAAGKGPYTVFAPTDAAFSAMSTSDLEELLLPSSRKRLQQFLAYHVVKGRLTSDQLKDGQTLTNLAGNILVVSKQENSITLKDGRGEVATVTQANIRATNGVVYSINRVLQVGAPVN